MMMDIFATVILLVVILYAADVVVTLWFVGIEEFLAPRYVHNLPGGAVYWFLVKGKGPKVS